MRRNWRNICWGGAVLTALLSILAVVIITTSDTAEAATPVAGARTAKAGAGGVTAERLVKLSAAGTIVTATAVTDSVVGVCELTASADALTRYAPVGTQTVVTSGEQIAVGDLLTTGAGGKAFVLDTDDASSQRIAAVALTAASGADEDVTVILTAGVAEQRIVIAGALKTQTSLICPGYMASSTTVAADALVIPVTHGVVEKTTGADAEALTLADGTAGQVLTITLVTDGGGDGTLTPATATGWTTHVFSDAGDTLALLYVDDTVGWVIAGTRKQQTGLVASGAEESSTTVDADVLVIPVTHGVVEKTTGADAEALTLANGTAGQVLTVTLATDGGGDGTLTPATATGWTTHVFSDAGDTLALLYVDDTVGWVIAGTRKQQTGLVASGAEESSTTVAADELVIPVTHGAVVKTTGADAEGLTLADGTPGQVLVITLGTDGNGDGTLTPATATGWATIVFADAGDTASLLFIDGTAGWVILGTAGVAAPPAISI